MILRRPHEFKIATLQDIRALFPRGWNPFYGGFGNRDTDVISYLEVPREALRRSAPAHASECRSLLPHRPQCPHPREATCGAPGPHLAVPPESKQPAQLAA
jgi:hypothetical protein